MNQEIVEPEDAVSRRTWLPEAAVFAAALVGRLPALGAWWCRDDWGQLARAAGHIGADAGLPARWLSQHAYWSITWPIFGLAASPHAIIRLLLHALCAVLVMRVGHRVGLGPAGRLVAGLLLAASPLAFTPLYWASGIQELLAAALALAAVERWLAGRTGGRRALLGGVFLAAASMLAKESGLGLPVLFLAFLWAGLGVRLQDKAFAWALVMLLLGVAVVEGTLVLQQFDTATGRSYDLGGAAVIATNLGIFGWWLLSPGPLLAGEMAWPMIAAGASLFVIWAAWGVTRWTQGRRLPLLALVAAVLTLAPALPLRQHVAPYLAYLAAAAWLLALGELVPRRWPVPDRVLIVAAVLAAAWGFFGMKTRLDQRTPLGLPADGLVAATSLSWDACRMLQDLDSIAGAALPRHVILVQTPAGPTSLDLAERFGERWVAPSDLHEALGGNLGLKLVTGADVKAVWASGLATAPADALVFTESGTGLRFWGRTANAALYAALADIGLGHFKRARRHLRRAGELNDTQISFVFDPGQMLVPLELVLRRKAAFVDWTVSLLQEGASPTEVGGLQDMFFNLLVSCTGLSLEDVTAGSRLLSGPSQPPALRSGE